MRISTDFLILCESTIIDSVKNTLNVLGVIDGASVSSLPAQLDNFRLVGRFTVFDSGDQTNIPITIKLDKPSGSSDIIEPDEGVYSLDIKGNTDTQRTGLISDLSIVIDEEGPHTFRVLRNDEEIAAQTLYVSKAE